MNNAVTWWPVNIGTKLCPTSSKAPTSVCHNITDPTVASLSALLMLLCCYSCNARSYNQNFCLTSKTCLLNIGKSCCLYILSSLPYNVALPRIPPGEVKNVLQNGYDVPSILSNMFQIEKFSTQQLNITSL